MALAARTRAWLLTSLALGLGSAAQEQFTGHASPALQTPASGSCQIVRWPAAAETRFAAMNYLQWGGSHYCGQCIEVWCGADSSREIVHVVDWCRDCQHGDLRLSPSVFQALTAGSVSDSDVRYEVQWRFVRCPEASDLGFQVCLRRGRSTQASLAIQPVNPAEPIRSIAINGVEAAREFPGLFYSIKDAQDLDLTRVRLTITTQSGATTENTISLESGECVRVDTTERVTQTQPVSAPRPRIRRGDGTAAVERSRNLGEASSASVSDTTITSTTMTTTAFAQSSGSGSATAGSSQGAKVSCSNVVRSSSGSSSGLDGLVQCQTTANGSSSTPNDSASASTSTSGSTAPTSIASSGSGTTTAPTAVTSGSESVASPSATTPTTASGSAASSTTAAPAVSSAPEPSASPATATSGSASIASTSTTSTTETTTDTTTITATTATDSSASQIASPYQSPQTQSTTSVPSESSVGSSTASPSSTSSSTPSSMESGSTSPAPATEESFSQPPIIATSQAPAIASSSSAVASSNSNSALQAPSSSSSAHPLSASGSTSTEQSSSGSGSLSSSMDAASMDDASSSQSQAHHSAEGSTKSNGTAVGSASNASDPSSSSAQTSMGDIFTSPLFFAALLLGIVGCAGSCAAYRAKKKSLQSATPRHPVVFTPTDIESSMEVHAPDPPYGTRTSRSSSVVRAMSNDLLAADVMRYPSATL